MKTKKTKVTLLSWTANPIETIYAEWTQSRTTDPCPIPEELADEINLERMDIWTSLPESVRPDPNHTPPGPVEKKVLEVFEKVVAMKMPLGETLDFVFLIENAPIALREQMVRHRIGHKFGERLGADIIPDLAGNSSFWSQTTRIIDMGKFATEGDYYTPVWLEENPLKIMPEQKKPRDCPKCKGSCIMECQPVTALDIVWFCQNCSHQYNDKLKTVAEFYHEQMRWIQAAYRRLVQAGMPLEDARGILPMYLQHRYTWKTNLSSLMHVLSKRGCWLAQLGMWEPVIHDITNELAEKVHPMFRRLIDPPCINPGTGEYGKCAFGRENEEIIPKGEYPPCSLWTNQEYVPMKSESLRKDGIACYEHYVEEKAVGEARLPRYNRMMEKYTKLWGRDPRTGERKVLA